MFILFILQGRGKEKNEGKVPDLGGVKPAPTA
jgi:hypothetical protein